MQSRVYHPPLGNKIRHLPSISKIWCLLDESTQYIAKQPRTTRRKISSLGCHLLRLLGNFNLDSLLGWRPALEFFRLWAGFKVNLAAFSAAFSMNHCHWGSRAIVCNSRISLVRIQTQCLDSPENYTHLLSLSLNPHIKNWSRSIVSR